MASRDDDVDELARLRRENALLADENQRLRANLAQQQRMNRVQADDLEYAESAVRVLRRRIGILVDRLDSRDSR